MFELGENAKLIHAHLYEIILKSKIQNVLMHGKLMEHLAAKLKNKEIDSKHFATRRLLRIYIDKTDLNNQVVLVKGSRGMRMEEFVEQIREKTK